MTALGRSSNGPAPIHSIIPIVTILQHPLNSFVPLCCARLSSLPSGLPLEQLPVYLADHPELCAKHPYLPDLARVEYHLHLLHNQPPPLPKQVREITVNPALELLQVNWSGLPELIAGQQRTPSREEGLILLLRRPGRNRHT